MISMLINLKLAVIFMTYRPCFTIPWRLDSLEEYREQRGTVFSVFFPFAFFFFNFSCCGIVLQKTAVRWKLRGKLFCRMQKSFRKSEQRQNILRWLHILCKRMNKYLYSCHLYKTAFPAGCSFPYKDSPHSCHPSKMVSCLGRHLLDLVDLGSPSEV